MTAVKNAPPAKEVSDLTEVQAPRQIKRGSQDALAWLIGRYAGRYRFYHAPVDITQVDHIRFGDLTIPVNPQEPPIRHSALSRKAQGAVF